MCWNKKNRRWQAAINASGKYIYLGSFSDEEEAARSFDKEALRVRGNKAKLNFPELKLRHLAEIEEEEAKRAQGLNGGPEGYVNMLHSQQLALGTDELLNEILSREP